MALLLHLSGPLITFRGPPPSPPPARAEFVKRWIQSARERCVLNAEGEVVATSKYFAKEVAWFSSVGESAILGTTRAEFVSLIPVSHYAAERVAVLFGSPDGGYVPAAAIWAAQGVRFNRSSERFEATIRRQRIERDGAFAFTAIPAGRYYVISQSRPQHYALREGYTGLVCRLVEVAESRTRHIRLAPTYSERTTDFAPLDPIAAVVEEPQPRRWQAVQSLWAVCRHADLRSFAVRRRGTTPVEAAGVFDLPDFSPAERSTCEHTAPTITQRTGSLQPPDLALVAKWANASCLGASSPQDLAKILGVHKANRLTSARQAEIAARNYFESSGIATEDVSIHQVSTRSREWVTHDLVAEGVSYDVKNARRSHASPRSYSEFTVPEFKRARQGGREADVRLLGVLSDYVPTSAFLDGNFQGRATVLGEVAASSIARANELAQEWTDGALTVSTCTNSSLLPGWFFEYPAWAYSAQDCAVTQLGSSLDAIMDWHVDLRSVPAVLLILGGRTDSMSIADGSAEQRLDALHQQRELTRLNLGVWALSELVLAARGVAGADPTRLAKMLFDGGGELPRSLPALLCDPEEFIATLLEAVNDTWRAAGQRLRGFKQFQLAGSGIFRGRADDARWRTIFSHCGGRDPKTKGKCGQSPLVLGTHANCAYCGRLVCHRCAYCSSQCAVEDTGPVDS